MIVYSVRVKALKEFRYVVDPKNKKIPVYVDGLFTRITYLKLKLEMLVYSIVILAKNDYNNVKFNINNHLRLTIYAQTGQLIT